MDGASARKRVRRVSGEVYLAAGMCSYTSWIFEL